MYQPDETIRLEVRLGEDTVWLSQQQMAELFMSSRTNIDFLCLYSDSARQYRSVASFV